MEQIEIEIVEFIEREIIPGSAVMELMPDQNLLTDGIIDSIGPVSYTHLTLPTKA